MDKLKNKTIYIATPVSEKPEKEGPLFTNIRFGTVEYNYNLGFIIRGTNGKTIAKCNPDFWLKPVDIEDLLNHFVDFTFKHGPDLPLEKVITDFLNEKGIK